jgi:pyruvate formate lyase activating enzyme
MNHPYIADIKRHSLEDGPGIRSVVFFKGCPLRCDFCHNPEMQRREAEIVFRVERCLACGQCVAACPRQAVSLDQPGRVDRGRCEACGQCAAVCPSSALALVGRRYSVEELVDVLLRDEAYYRRSGGGVTFSGGECTLFPEYLADLARALRARQVHLLVETCGEFDGTRFVDEILPLIDLVYFDVKLADPAQHRRHTGRDNARILDNLARLVRAVPERLQVRIPLVPGSTATDENLRGVATLLRQLGVRRAILLPYHPLGRTLAAALGRDTSAVPARFMTRDEVDDAAATFAAAAG